jgi:hypothetical protein
MTTNSLDFDGFTRFWPPEYQNMVSGTPTMYVCCLYGYTLGSAGRTARVSFIFGIVFKSLSVMGGCPVNMNILGQKNAGPSDEPQKNKMIFSKMALTILINFQ